MGIGSLAIWRRFKSGKSSKHLDKGDVLSDVIMMTDQIELSYDSGAVGSHFESVGELYTLSERVTSQDHQILRILRTPVTIAPSSPSTSTLPATQETDASIIAVFAAPTTIATIPETTVYHRTY
ncbi:hypothetical protein Sjap_012825 [Stephania japonica]|uniref:Uncharacterized protein n=1 Tax=Stephania japonica TaxID=461633 RepID=A0AAP0IWX2_9MAGN